MKVTLLLVICLVCVRQTLAQQQPNSTEQKKVGIPKNRVDAGVGKPELFAARKKNLSSQPSNPPNLLPVVERVFQDAKLRDTINFTSDAGTLRAVIMTLQNVNGAKICNLKVISHQNALMRLERYTTDGSIHYNGFVHHPDFSDALLLIQKDQSFTFSIQPLFNVVNE